MTSMRTFVLALLTVLFFVSSSVAHAFPFGGQITLYHVCYNSTIFTRLSPPVPGDYVWTTATRTYQFGPPRSAGQWLLGLTGIPFDCLWSVSPIFIVPAISISMMGSSNTSFKGVSSGGYTADPTLRGGGFGTGYSTNVGATQYTGLGGGAATPNVLITEVYAAVDSAHGTDPKHEWVELYNGTTASVDVSGWTISSDTGSDRLPSGTSIGAGSYLLISQTNELRDYWTIPIDVRMVALNSPIGNGLSRTSDSVTIRSASGTAIDAVSWGTSTAAFSPAVPIVLLGHSLSRNSIFTDKNVASDWADRTTPSPGN